MRRIRQVRPLLLLAIFWFAQLQGTVHAISHFHGASGVSAHTLVAPEGFCAECAALAQAGAGPLPSFPTSLPASPPRHVLPAVPVPSFAAAPATFYRSRAPPSVSDLIATDATAA